MNHFTTGFYYYTHYGELLEEKVEEYIDNLIFEHETYGKIKHALELHKHRLDEDNNFLMQGFLIEAENELEFRLDKTKLV